MIKSLLFFVFFLITPVFADEVEITKWFNLESEQFLEIMNSSDAENQNNYEQYQNFVDKNFALKSIAYGLINETIIEKNSEKNLLEYQKAFRKYLINTIYNLANTNLSSEITLKDIDIKDNIYIINSDITDGKSSISLYWKVAKIKNVYKIIDVIVENTSYFVTKKSEFTKILRKNRGDLNKLTQILEEI